MLNAIIIIAVTNVVAFTLGFIAIYKIAKKVDKASCE